MEKELTVTAVSGWALPTGWYQALIEKSLPQAKVNVLYPSLPGDVLEAENLLEGSRADLYIGYSLGSLWLMTHQEMLPENSVKAALAPILAFASERNRGGKTPETKLKYLARQLRRKPEDLSPILNFYAGCEIQFPEPLLKTLPDSGILLNGLEFLQSAPVPEMGLEKFAAFVGENDSLMDGEPLKSHLPQLEIVPAAGHAPGPLLNRLAASLNL